MSRCSRRGPACSPAGGSCATRVRTSPPRGRPVRTRPAASSSELVDGTLSAVGLEDHLAVVIAHNGACARRVRRGTGPRHRRAPGSAAATQTRHPSAHLGSPRGRGSPARRRPRRAPDARRPARRRAPRVLARHPTAAARCHRLTRGGLSGPDRPAVASLMLTTQARDAA